MYQYYQDPGIGGLFVRHFGAFEGGEHLKALAMIAGDSSIDRSNIKSILIDAREVTSADMSNTDRAYMFYQSEKIQEMTVGQKFNICRLLNPHSPSYPMLLARGQVTPGNHYSASNADGEYLGDVPGFFATFISLDRAYEFCGFPDDYLIDWSLAKSPAE